MPASWHFAQWFRNTVDACPTGFTAFGSAGGCGVQAQAVVAPAATVYSVQTAVIAQPVALPAVGVSYGVGFNTGIGYGGVGFGAGFGFNRFGYGAGFNRGFRPGFGVPFRAGFHAGVGFGRRF